MAKTIPRDTKKIIATIVAAALVIGCLWWVLGHTGLVAGRAQHSSPPQTRRTVSKDRVLRAVHDYNAGNYKDAEAAALDVVKSASGAKDLRIREDAVRARYILAFAAARRKDMKLSRDRFTVLQKEAAKLPDKGAQPPTPGMTSPTLEEEGAYQHAVCTAALGDKKAAEAEYISFMRDYPESTLIHGAVKRIELLHDGHLPKYAEAAWAKANGTAIARAQARREAEEKKWSRCGPLCMAEIFRRHGHALGVDALAKELKTGDKGTTMQAMADVAKKHGLKPRGLALTQKGLVKQPLPLIALIMPGHYVIVEEVTVDHVAVWDPYAKGVDKPGRTTFAIKRWKMMWGGVALVFENKLDPGGQDAD